MKPLLLIDVDGPLNPWDNKPSRRPEHYQTFRFALRGHDLRRPWRVWLRPEHGEWLLSLADEFELTWCTQWQDQANRFVAPVLGLPELPWIRFPGSLGDNTAWWKAGWKYPQVAEYAGGRPLVWLDDDFEARLLDGHREAFLAERGSLPTVLFQVDPRYGLQRWDVGSLRGWSREHCA